jgi:hypothetical protein
MMPTLLCLRPPKNQGGYVKSIKWQQANSHYETHSWILENMELDTLLLQCLDVKAEVLVVATVEAQALQSI